MQENTKRKPDSVRKANRVIQQRTLVLMAFFGVLTFAALFLKLYDLQINQHEQLQEKALNQQTSKTVVTASRGTIYDCNGNMLAFSATAETVFISPKEILENQLDQKLIASGLAQILEVEEADILKKMEKTKSQYEIIRKNVEQDIADQVRSFIKENELSGIYLTAGSKRYYPYSSLAAHVLGFIGTDNYGLSGLEKVYNDQLEGSSGLTVTAKDAHNRRLLYQYEQYFDAQNGDSLQLTIDTSIQFYLEKGLEKAVDKYQVANGATGIVINPKTGAIYAMASMPTYDANDFSTIYDTGLAAQLEEGASLGDLQKKQWRNKCVNETYQPGSTFKILTLSMALEEGVVNDNSTFECTGALSVDGMSIRCSNRRGHGHQVLKEAVANSCNPAFINIGWKVGNQKFYQYMQDFGLISKSGIDTTGEAVGFVNSEILTSRLALACYAFGQNFNVSPIALISAQAACVNGGYLRTPYLVERIQDQDGKTIQQHDTTPIRQVISEDTSAKVREILEYVVSDGTGKNGQVSGYRIGGKTGTADKTNGELIVSFVCFAPAEDPQVMMLITLDEPGRDCGTYTSGGQMVAPIASEIMSEILPYLGLNPSYTAEELVGADTTVPNVVGSSLDTAAAKLSAEGFSYKTIGSGDTVTAQTPEGGAIIPGNAQILLYMGEEKPDTAVVVPNVVGKSAEAANTELTNAGLIMKISGATGSNSGTVRAISQSVSAGSEVKAGTVVTVQLGDTSITD
mgnify:CR=1 FL=1